MRARIFALLAGAAGLLLATGCFDKPKPECSFLCGDGDACPDGYSCRADGWCKANGVADDFACVGTAPDAATNVDAGDDIDASPADAATFDAPVIDAPPPPDAPMIDAMPPDAMPPDADPPDADPPDAMPPDAFVNSDPMLSIPGSNPRIETVNQAFSFTVTGSDPDSGQTVTVSAAYPSASSAGNPFTETPPATFTPGTEDGVFSWTPPNVGTFEVEFTVTDDYTSPASTSEVLVITVNPGT